MSSTVAWQHVRLPPVERIVLADLAARRGISDEQLLIELIHVEALRVVTANPDSTQE